MPIYAHRRGPITDTSSWTLLSRHMLCLLMRGKAPTIQPFHRFDRSVTGGVPSAPLGQPHSLAHSRSKAAVALERQMAHVSPPRKLAAILAADVVGYGRLMEEDEAATVQELKGHQAVILPTVGRHGGRVVDTAGDGILAEFPSAINATECAVEIQTIMATRNEAQPESRRMRFRLGINLGDVIHDETRIYGDGVNVAARLQTYAEPGGVVVSGAVAEQIVSLPGVH